MLGKTDIELVTGFLGAGKTSFLQSFIDISGKADEDLLILQCERGRTELSDELIKRKNVTLKKYKKNEELDMKNFMRIINFYAPKRIIIECNGVSNLDDFLTFLNVKELKRKVKVTGIITVVDSVTLNMFIKNMGSLIIPNLRSADLIVMNNCDSISEEKKLQLESMLKAINLHAHILQCRSFTSLYEDVKNCSIIKKFV
ncbi:GTP-binding protein [Clostridium sp. C8-1-8]|uniref:GTP-binding protein n=1 Tax=Clostridium sp. C8-1-8 TaxID=2698831 RepID=UPI00136FA3B5|nr:GTP-binding protein [Clostridium sp. C8-1-8]